MTTKIDTKYHFPLGQFQHCRYFLEWAKSHYKSFRKIYDKQGPPFQPKSFEEISLAVILSVMALEAFLNEMAVHALKNSPNKLTEQDKERLKRQTESGQCSYWSIKVKLSEFTKMVVGKNFPKGRADSHWANLRRLLRYRNDLVHLSPDSSDDLSLGWGYRVQKNGGLIKEDNIMISGTQMVFRRVAENCDFDPSTAVKGIITNIVNLGYKLDTSFKDALTSI